MGQEERRVAFTAAVEALRRNLCDQCTGTEVEDVRNDPIVGVIAVLVRVQGRDDNAFHDELYLVVWYPVELVVQNGTCDGDGLVNS